VVTQSRLDLSKQYIHPGNSKPTTITASKTLKLKNDQYAVIVQAETMCPVIVSHATTYVIITLINQAPFVRIEGVELILRGPDFTKAVQVDNCVQQWKGEKFPLKLGMERIYYPFKLPFLPPTSHRERYTLSLRPFGKGINKKDSFQVSIPLAVCERYKLFVHNPNQVFETPIDVILLREGTQCPRLIANVIDFFTGDPARRSKDIWQVANAPDSPRVAWLRYLYDSGSKENILSTRHVKDPRTVVQLFRDFLLHLPEPIIPSELWSRCENVSNMAQDAQDYDSERASRSSTIKPTEATIKAEIQSILEAIPEERRSIVVKLVGFIGDLERALDIKSISKTLAPAIARPPERAATAISNLENSRSAEFVALLVQQ